MAKICCMLYLAAVITLIQGAPEVDTTYATIRSSEKQQRLAVIVPVFHEDLQQAVSSLKRWPVICSPLTQHNTDLVLYYAEGGDEHGEEVNEAVDAISRSAGKCFNRTRAVYGKLDKAEVHLEEISSVLFYKMFLDQDVSAELAEYGALAIVEWDTVVAADDSFEELYKAAFTSEEDVWVKGSNNMEDIPFHPTVKEKDVMRLPGYINGNAIYNNNDPEFVKYIGYTFTKWHYDYPYSVALGLTLSDIPYGLSLYQRYSEKFVTTNLFSHAGVESMDGNAVPRAAGDHALFIQGIRVDEASLTSGNSVLELSKMRPQLRATSHNRQ